MKRFDKISELKFRVSYGVTVIITLVIIAGRVMSNPPTNIGSNAGTRVYGFVPNSVPITT